MEYRRCTKGIWDTTVPGITFDENGASNYSKMIEKMMELYPRGEEGRKKWEKRVQEMKEKGRGKDFDCIIGVSGGTDSSYLMHLSRQYGLRPLAVMLDNGWSSDISVKNIRKVTSKLGIDLETYVVEYDEMKDILCSYIKASMPWVDFPTDHAIKSALYRIADREGIKYILIGHDFRSEGMQPNEWSNSDDKQLNFIHHKFGKTKISSFPNMSLLEHIYLGYIKGIKMVYPYFLLDYSKKDAQKLLTELYGWEYYGGHHHENLFTKFAIAYWMPEKFKMDKRLITLSAQVMSGEIAREKALEMIAAPAYNPDEIEREVDYTIKKLGLTKEEFDEYWARPNKSFLDYPSHHKFMTRFVKLILPFVRFVMPQMPSYFVMLQSRKA